MENQEQSKFDRFAEHRLKPIKSLNNSGLMQFKTCPWKFKLWKMGIRPKTQYIPFAVGSLIHIGIATLYTRRITRASDRFYQMLDILEQKWNRNLSVNTTPEYMKRMDRQFFLMRGIFYGLVKQRIIEKDLDEYEVLQSESKLGAALLYGMTWEGTPDLVLQHKKDKWYTHFDHKSTSRVDDNFAKSLNTSVELEGDKFLIEQVHGIELKCGFYNVLQKHYLYERKNESRELYAERVLEQYKETKFNFRIRKDYTPELKANWLKQQGNWIKMLRHCETDNDWPMNDESCTGIYNCDMLEYCSSRKDHIFDALYHKVKTVKKGRKK